MENVVSFDSHKVVEVFSANLGSDVIDWGLQAIKAPVAWNTTKGEGVKVAILDTGVDTNHPDLKPNIKAVANFTSSFFGVRDRCGHGSHVAGIIAGVDNGQGIVGVAPHAELHIAKILGDNGSGDINAIIQGIRWAIAQGVDVINMSLGTSVEPPQELHNAIKEATNAGIVIIAATGNEDSAVCWPAKFPETIAVSAIDNHLQKAYFSNHGIENEICAPGVDILSTYKDGGYAKLSGTSMATPIITGAAALFISDFKRKFGRRPSVEEVHSALLKATDDLGTAGKDEDYGVGMIDLAKMF